MFRHDLGLARRRGLRLCLTGRLRLRSRLSFQLNSLLRISLGAPRRAGLSVRLTARIGLSAGLCFREELRPLLCDNLRLAARCCLRVRLLGRFSLCPRHCIKLSLTLRVHLTAMRRHRLGLGLARRSLGCDRALRSGQRGGAHGRVWRQRTIFRLPLRTWCARTSPVLMRTLREAVVCWLLRRRSCWCWPRCGAQDAAAV